MARIIEQRNVWGRTKGQEPQRLDLWALDMTSAVQQIAEQLGIQLPDIPGYFAASVTVPELRVLPDVVRRDSRPYNMPGWDNQLDAVRVNFIVDANPESDQSIIYQTLDAWRTLVRAGRGSMSSEMSVNLNQNYRVDYSFDIMVYLLRGNADFNAVVQAQSTAAQLAFSTARAFGDTANQWNNPVTRAMRDRVQNFADQYDNQQPGESDDDYQKRLGMQIQLKQQIIQANMAAKETGASPTIKRDTFFEAVFNNNLKISGVLLLKRAWLGSMRFAELNYANSGVLTLEAQFFVEDVVRQIASGNQPDLFSGCGND